MLNVEKYLDALVSHDEIICIKERDDSGVTGNGNY